jgi:hypothetical protein
MHINMMTLTTCLQVAESTTMTTTGSDAEARPHRPLVSAVRVILRQKATADEARLGHAVAVAVAVAVAAEAEAEARIVGHIRTAGTARLETKVTVDETTVETATEGQTGEIVAAIATGIGTGEIIAATANRMIARGPAGTAEIGMRCSLTAVAAKIQTGRPPIQAAEAPTQS